MLQLGRNGKSQHICNAYFVLNVHHCALNAWSLLKIVNYLVVLPSWWFPSLKMCFRGWTRRFCSIAGICLHITVWQYSMELGLPNWKWEPAGSPNKQVFNFAPLSFQWENFNANSPSSWENWQGTEWDNGLKVFGERMKESACYFVLVYIHMTAWVMFHCFWNLALHMCLATMGPYKGSCCYVTAVYCIYLHLKVLPMIKLFISLIF